MRLPWVGAAARSEHNATTSIAATRPSFIITLIVISAVVAASQRWYAQAEHDPEDVWLGFALTATLWSWLRLACYAAQRYLPQAASLTVKGLSAAVFVAVIGPTGISPNPLAARSEPGTGRGRQTSALRAGSARSRKHRAAESGSPAQRLVVRLRAQLYGS